MVRQARLVSLSLAAMLVLSLLLSEQARAAEEPAAPAATPADDTTTLTPSYLAGRVTIYRDDFGVPHIDGVDDEAAVFGFGYCQAEDYFWQIEDSYVMGLGRYAELYGKKFLGKDLLNRAFEVPQRSREDFEQFEPRLRRICIAFTAGINHYLDEHPQVKPRLLKRFEPWYMLSFGRAAVLELTGGHIPTSIGSVPTSFTVAAAGEHDQFQETLQLSAAELDYQKKLASEMKAATGSNAWAIAPSKTREGHAMLFVNPHQPYFGFGQFYEAHLRSGSGLNFNGATFFGSPLPTLGHNEHCGWAFTVNEPNTSSAWRETFDDPANPLNYRYGDGYRTATEWKDKIRIKHGRKFDEQEVTFRKTHHGPILKKNSDTEYVSGMIGKFYDAMLARQTYEMLHAKNLADFQKAMKMNEFHIFNTVYADDQGNIQYVYNGICPRRDPQFDWSKPVDGSDPHTEWQGYHAIEDFPQVLNPATGYVQSCNSTPYTTTDDFNPAIGDFPNYMVRDQHDDKRRAKVSRMLLRDLKDVTFDKWLEVIFDTTIYWPMVELPEYRRKLAALKESDPALAHAVEPLLEHLSDWDCKGSLESTQTTLCMAWYEELYGFGYPAETLKAQFVANPTEQLKALVAAAGKLKSNFGNWQVPWGEVNRLQRHADVSDFFVIPFNDNQPSLPSAGLHGPPGVAFTMYFTPSVYLPPLKLMKKHYAVVGTSYMAAIEFGPKVTSRTLVQYGASGDPKSPHFFDQAKLLSERKLRPSLYSWDEIRSVAKRTYHPGDEPESVAAKP